LGAHGPPSPRRCRSASGWTDGGAPSRRGGRRRPGGPTPSRWTSGSSPYAGGVRLRDLGHARVRDWRADIIADGCPPTQANKTYQRRTVEIVAPLDDDLDLLRPRVADPDALIVADRDGGVLDLSHWRSRVLAPAAVAAGVRMTPYDGRHTCASLLIHEGRSLAYVAAFLGHASVTTTARYYTHLFDESRLRTAAPMVATIAGARADLERRGVYPRCSRDPVRVLRSPARTAKARR
jgi:hypothetical protein